MTLPAFLRRALRALTLEPLRLAPRHRLALLALLAAVMIATPLAGALRLHARDLEQALLAQATLDPLGRALALQRALLAHREPAARVLRTSRAADPGAETELAARQAQVDERLAALTGAVGALRHALATIEVNAMRGDWIDLVARLRTRTIDEAGNHLAHRLLIEQTLQVHDLIADPQAGLDDAAAPLRVALRLIELDELEAAPATPARAARATQLRRWIAEAAADGGGAGAVTARAALRARLERPGDGAATASALAALVGWSGEAERAQAGALAARIASIADARRRLVALSGAVGLVGFAGAALLMRPPRRRRRTGDDEPPEGAGGPDPDAVDTVPAGGENRLPAEALLDRLRQTQPRPESERPPRG